MITYAGGGSQGSCLETSGQLAYKNTNNGLYSIPVTNHHILKKNIVMDNGAGGFGTRLTCGDYHDGLIEVTENQILGESPIPDCPDETNGDYCIKIDKFATVAGGFGAKKDLHPLSASKFPYWAAAAHNWAGLTHWTKNYISDFGGKTRYDKREVVFGS